MPVEKSGDWALAKRLVTGLPDRLLKATDTALRQEAQQLRSEMMRGITRQAPGGQSFAPLSPYTLAARRLKGFEGKKALVVAGDLRNAISVVMRRGHAFVGVPRKARSKDGKSLADVAQLHEFGSDPIVIPITPAMRRYLFALRREMGEEPPRDVGSGPSSGVVVTQIPARPFIRPAVEAFKRGADKRFLQRVAKLLHFTG